MVNSNTRIYWPEQSNHHHSGCCEVLCLQRECNWKLCSTRLCVVMWIQTWLQAVCFGLYLAIHFRVLATVSDKTNRIAGHLVIGLQLLATWNTTSPVACIILYQKTCLRFTSLGLKNHTIRVPSASFDWMDSTQLCVLIKSLSMLFCDAVSSFSLTWQRNHSMVSHVQASCLVLKLDMVSLVSNTDNSMQIHCCNLFSQDICLHYPPKQAQSCVNTLSQFWMFWSIFAHQR